MKKAFGKWLMDIANYMVTAILLSSVFENVERAGLFFLCLVFSGGILVAGLLLIKEPKKQVKERSFQKRRR